VLSPRNALTKNGLTAALNAGQSVLLMYQHLILTMKKFSQMGAMMNMDLNAAIKSCARKNIVMATMFWFFQMIATVNTPTDVVRYAEKSKNVSCDQMKVLFVLLFRHVKKVSSCASLIHLTREIVVNASMLHQRTVKFAT
jgi:hypothetical protein